MVISNENELSDENDELFDNNSISQAEYEIARTKIEKENKLLLDIRNLLIDFYK